MDDERRRRFRGEAMHRLEFDHLVPHRTDDAPAAGRSAAAMVRAQAIMTQYGT